MRIVKKPRKKIAASEEVIDEVATSPNGEGAPAGELVEVAPEATELLFETEDVAELLAEVTEEEVVVDVDDETEEITFEVGGEPFIIEPEGDEAILESSRAILKGKKVVKASRSARPRMARPRMARRSARR